jgi:cytochrome c oxidase subunit IV
MASDAHAAHGEHHVTPLKTYYIVFGCLLTLTGLTYAVSFAGFEPKVSIVIAMAVAMTKATLVGAWFMHLAHDVKFNIFTFLSALWFATIFWVFTMADVTSRGAILEDIDNFTHRQDNAPAASVAPPAAPAEGGAHH